MPEGEGSRDTEGRSGSEPLSKAHLWLEHTAHPRTFQCFHFTQSSALNSKVLTTGTVKLGGLLDSSARPSCLLAAAYCPRVAIISFPPFAQKAVGSNQGSIQTVCFNPASLPSTSFIGRTVGDSYYLPSPPLGQEHSPPDSRASSLIPNPVHDGPCPFS